jgi:nuclear-control-of-ATPase protein 2
MLRLLLCSLLLLLLVLVVSAGVSIAGVVWLYRHSRLSGSTDLEVWCTAAVDTLEGSWREHVVEPLMALRNELFSTFRE